MRYLRLSHLHRSLHRVASSLLGLRVLSDVSVLIVEGKPRHVSSKCSANNAANPFHMKIVGMVRQQIDQIWAAPQIVTNCCVVALVKIEYFGQAPLSLPQLALSGKHSARLELLCKN